MVGKIPRVNILLFIYSHVDFNPENLTIKLIQVTLVEINLRTNRVLVYICQ